MSLCYKAVSVLKRIVLITTNAILKQIVFYLLHLGGGMFADGTVVEYLNY